MSHQREIVLNVSIDFDVPAKLSEGDISYNEIVLREGCRVADNVHEEYHRGHLDATDAYQKTIENLKSENYRLEQVHSETLHAELRRQRCTHDKMVKEIQEEMCALREENAELKTMKSCSPYIDKGKLGEVELLAGLNTFLPEYNHEDTSSQNHAGDARTTGPGIATNILYDSKYKSTKPRRCDYEKLDRDMEEQNSVVGIMVWRNDEIVSSPILLTHVDTKRPIITVRITKETPWMVAVGFYVAKAIVENQGGRKRSYDETRLEDFVNNMNTLVKNELEAGLSHWRKVFNSVKAGKKHYEMKILTKMRDEVSSYCGVSSSKKRRLN
jgi:hypothetical protein